MLSTNARKVLFSLVGITIVSFIVQLGLTALILYGDLNVAPYENSWVQLITAIVVAIFGILIGLVFEQWWRPRYVAMFEKNPALSDRIRKVYSIVLIISVIGGAIYILVNVWALYAISALGIAITITSAQRTATLVGIARYIAVALAMLWLFAEPKKVTVPSTINIKKLLLFSTRELVQRQL